MEFLLENPLIIVILIGIISSLFKKGKNETEPPKKKQSRTFWETVQPPKFDSFPEVKPLQKSKGYIEEPEQPVRSIQEDYLEAQRKADSLKRDAEEIERNIKLNEAKRSSNVAASIENNDFQVDSKRLADAVIWSEILGPPRARRPHRSMYGKRN